MGSRGEPQQAMTRERLAEIKRWVHDPDYYFASCDDDSEWLAIRDLLAEVERQRAALAAREAREAALANHVNEALTDIAQSVLESGGLPPEQFPLDHARVTIVSVEKRLKQARALLDSASAAGSDGEQTAQGET